MTTGERIKMLRKEHNLTQEELGAKIGVQKAAIQKYEKGTVKNIKRDSLIKLAQYLETTPEYLLGWDDTPSNIEISSETDFVKIPVVGRVAAGISCFADNNILDYEPVPKNEVRGGDQYAFLRVIGDSMYPVFMEGDLVLVRCQSSVDSGSYAVVTIDEEDGVIKRIVYGDDFIELQSINPMYPPRRFEGEEVLRIRVFGLVREIKRKF
ncbi:MAG: XRE family transcriptional regulator [Oscillospiraceae bacterium]|nr:XRE family transcriptional regulator [Oscillospiraceae bacterium]